MEIQFCMVYVWGEGGPINGRSDVVNLPFMGWLFGDEIFSIPTRTAPRRGAVLGAAVGTAAAAGVDEPN